VKEFEKDGFIEYLADKYEIPKEQAMLVFSTIEISQDLGYFDSYYVGSDSIVESIFDKVFNVS
jgi:hypothetical protein